LFSNIPIPHPSTRVSEPTLISIYEYKTKDAIILQALYPLTFRMLDRICGDEWFGPDW
jgi:hypothetical protein